jgi:AcrR family transcriptional regulator
MKNEEDQRRPEILDAAFGVFSRYGYRKTSMDEVARIAGLSRQGLYLHFRSKQTLFKETAIHAYERSLSGVRDALADASIPIEDRLVRAFDAMGGQYVELLHDTHHLVELAETTKRLVGTIESEYQARFVDEIASALQSAGGTAAYEPLGLTVHDVASTLFASSRGLKHSNPTRSAYLDGVKSAIRLICAPLIPGSQKADSEAHP